MRARNKDPRQRQYGTVWHMDWPIELNVRYRIGSPRTPRYPHRPFRGSGITKYRNSPFVPIDYRKKLGHRFYSNGARLHRNKLGLTLLLPSLARGEI